MKHLAVLPALALAACTTTTAGYPPRADVEAVTAAKPKPTAAILTDPAANALYASKIEAWGDAISAAGKRLCRFYETTGMDVDCPG